MLQQHFTAQMKDTISDNARTITERDVAIKDWAENLGVIVKERHMFKEEHHDERAQNQVSSAKPQQRITELRQIGADSLLVLAEQEQIIRDLKDASVRKQQAFEALEAKAAELVKTDPEKVQRIANLELETAQMD